MFDLTVAIGQIDMGLAGERDRLVKLDDGDKWKPEEDLGLDAELYEKYKGELYVVLCSVTRRAQEYCAGDCGRTFGPRWFQSFGGSEPQV